MFNIVENRPGQKNRSLYIIILCFSVAVILLLSSKLGEKLAEIADEKSNGEEITSNISNVDTNNTNNITEEEKSMINSKIELLFSGNKIENNMIKVTSLQNIWSSLFKGNISELDIQKVLIKSFTEKDFTTYKLTNGKFANEAYKTIVDDSLSTGIPSISVTKLNDKYKLLTGKEMTKFEDLSTGCPSYAYDSENKVYLELAGCGGAGTLGQYIYIDSYNKSNDSITVNTYVAGISLGVEAEIYEDYYDDTLENQNSKIVKTTSVNAFNSFVIDNTNKESFTKYSFIFTKGLNGDYYFQSIKKD